MDVVTLGAALNGSKKYTDNSVQALMGGVHYKGEVNYYNNLPNDAQEGDTYTVKYLGTSGSDPDGGEYVWGKNQQGELGWRDFSKDCYTKTETNRLLADKQSIINSQNKLSADLVDDTNSTHKFVTAAEKQTWNGKQDALTFDNAPTQNSTNPVTSGGVHTALAGKLDDKTTHMTINGIDVYVSNTQPTGTIRENSIGFGW